MTLDVLSEQLKKNGVVGAGGAGFPTYAKLNKNAKTLILNCAECEPLLTLHRQMLEKYVVEIFSALNTIKEILEIEEVIIGVKDEYKNTIDAINIHINSYSNFRLELLSEVYPMGDEVVLIYEATKKVVPPGKLPIDVGVIVFNVETMYNAYYAINENKPVTHKYVTIAGAVNKPCTVKIPIGSQVHDILYMADGLALDEDDTSYLIGGPMMGFIGNKHTIITKTTNAILVLPKTHKLITSKNVNSSVSINRVASSCCQCQSCTDLCPRHNLGHPIKPHLFMRAVANKDFTDTNTFINTFFCSGCGVCEKFACPQSLMPRTIITDYKNNLRKAGVTIPKDVVFEDVHHSREYKKVPEKRLEMTLGLTKYKNTAPLNEQELKIDTVVIPLSQHIGKPCTPIVEKGQYVKNGELIGGFDDSLCVGIHSSVDGKVVEITDKNIVIKK